MQQRIESLILRNLIHNEEYSRKVLPFLKDEYFMENTDKLLYKQVDNFINELLHFVGRILFSDTEQDHQTRSDLPHRLTIDLDTCLANSLQTDSHVIIPRRWLT